MGRTGFRVASGNRHAGDRIIMRDKGVAVKAMIPLFGGIVDGRDRTLYSIVSYLFTVSYVLLICVNANVLANVPSDC